MWHINQWLIQFAAEKYWRERGSAFAVIELQAQERLKLNTLVQCFLGGQMCSRFQVNHSVQVYMMGWEGAHKGQWTQTQMGREDFCIYWYHNVTEVLTFHFKAQLLKTYCVISLWTAHFDTLTVSGLGLGLHGNLSLYNMGPWKFLAF